MQFNIIDLLKLSKPSRRCKEPSRRWSNSTLSWARPGERSLCSKLNGISYGSKISACEIKPWLTRNKSERNCKKEKLDFILGFLHFISPNSSASHPNHASTCRILPGGCYYYSNFSFEKNCFTNTRRQLLYLGFFFASITRKPQQLRPFFSSIVCLFPSSLFVNLFLPSAIWPDPTLYSSRKLIFGFVSRTPNQQSSFMYEIEVWIFIVNLADEWYN